MPNANPYKQLKPVSRQALTNFVNLKSNTIMKKPQYKDTVAASFCQVFYRQYMLSPGAFFSKKCYRSQNYIHYNQKLLKLTVKRGFSTEISDIDLEYQLFK